MDKSPLVMLIKAPSYSDVVSPPLGIGYLAYALRGLARVVVVDGVKCSLNERRLTRLIRKERPDMIGFSVVTSAAANTLALASAARGAAPGAVIFAGGAHPTAQPEEFFEAAGGDLDFLALGEGERSLAAVVQAGGGRLPADEVLRTIPGIFRADGDGLVQTAPHFIPDIDDLGRPAWELMPPASYPRSPHGAFCRLFPAAPIITSRGCPYSCAFCAAPRIMGRGLRFRSAGAVAEELTLLRDAFGVREFQIVDDNFTISKERSLEICQSIIDNRLVMPWSCPNGVRVENLDEELLEAMKAAGCYSLSIGVESASRDVLGRMDKHLDLDRAAGVIEAAHRLGFEVNGFFMLGYPGESRAEMRQTVRLARRLPLKRANFALFLPLPGSAIYEKLAGDGLAPPLADLTFADVSYVPRGMSAAEFKALQRWAILSFYSRPDRALSLARNAFRSPQTAWYVLRRAFKWLGRPV